MTWQQQSVYHRDSWRNEMPCGSRYEHWTDEKPPPARNMYTFEPIQRPVWSQEQPRGILTPLLSLQLSPPPPSRFLPQQNPVDLNYRPCQYMAPRKHKKKRAAHQIKRKEFLARHQPVNLLYHRLQMTSGTRSLKEFSQQCHWSPKRNSSTREIDHIEFSIRIF
ncbi:hypothetical protein L3Y34_010099 [Caenorhabditis briggsae]|uniref:Uncharacterized protein n=1 Tax=Caenorhabditis briggsae TaxID=6238 RepID=A0AAE9D2R7_CAEBR|nr:hypothetical protein L3Y34_010099 [Caenorhabditis briggsae]